MNIRIPQRVNDRIDDIAVGILCAAFWIWRQLATLPGIAADLCRDAAGRSRRSDGR